MKHLCGPHQSHSKLLSVLLQPTHQHTPVLFRRAVHSSFFKKHVVSEYQGIPLYAKRALELQLALSFKQYVSMVGSNLSLPVSLWGHCSTRRKHELNKNGHKNLLTDCFIDFFPVSKTWASSVCGGEK